MTQLTTDFFLLPHQFYSNSNDAQFIEDQIVRWNKVRFVACFFILKLGQFIVSFITFV